MLQSFKALVGPIRISQYIVSANNTPKRPALTRGVRQQAVLQRRTFLAPTAALRGTSSTTPIPIFDRNLLTVLSKADIVQDLYIKELKAYKLPPVKPSDAEGHVQKFSPPKAPRSPEEGDIANDLKAYEAQQVEVEGNDGGEGAVGGEDWSDWFEDEEDEEGKSAH